MMSDIIIAAAARTAVGNFNGGLTDVSAHDLGATVIRALLERSSVDPLEISDVILGQVLTAGQGQNPARQAAIKAGLPATSTALTINQVCGSGLRAVGLAMQAIKCGDASIVIAGGQENMSQAPHTVNLRKGTKMGPASMEDTMIKDGLWDAFHDYHMGITAENVATSCGISRENQDRLAAESQRRAARCPGRGKIRSGNCARILSYSQRGSYRREGRIHSPGNDLRLSGQIASSLQERWNSHRRKCFRFE